MWVQYQWVRAVGRGGFKIVFSWSKMDHFGLKWAKIGFFRALIALFWDIRVYTGNRDSVLGIV